MGNKKNDSPNADPKKRAVEMLEKVYEALPAEGKDMPKGEFIQQSLNIIQEHKKIKHSPIIRPGF